MGLDIYAVSRAEKVDPCPVRKIAWCEREDHHVAYVADSRFVLSLRGLDAGMCYTPTVGSEQVRFSAGSYHGYNHWRATLSQTVNGLQPESVWHQADALAHLPFFELINFSDCEGTIGPEAAADLVQDFDDYSEIVREAQGEEDPFARFVAQYDRWREAFLVASDGGMVVLR